MSISPARISLVQPLARALALLLVTFVAGCGKVAQTPPEPASKPIAEKAPAPMITYVSNNVEVSKETGPWAPAETGAQIVAGLKLRTQEQAEMDIKLWKDGGVKLDENTEIKVETIKIVATQEGEAVDARLEVLRGRVFIKTRKLDKASKFELKPPTGLVIVRGTAFYIEVQPSREARIVVREGMVDVSSMANLANAAKVGSNQAVSLSKSEVSAVKPSTAAENALLDRTDQIVLRSSTNLATMAGPTPAVPSKAMTINLGGGVLLDLVWIPPGEFMMGSPTNEVGRNADVGKETLHKVTISKGFWMGKNEVTQAQWERIMGNNPSRFKDAGKNAPVEQVSWDDCQEFLKKLNTQVANQKSRIEDVQFRLPTEAEWEYACRAGTKTAYSFGDDPAQMYLYGNYRDSSSGLPVGEKWWERTDLDHDDGIKTTAPAGMYRPNAWGLYDMHGNVWEWCQNSWFDYVDNVKEPIGPASGQGRVLRGGSWFDQTAYSRCAFRHRLPPIARNHDLGLRVAASR